MVASRDGQYYDTCIPNTYFKYKIGFCNLYLIGLMKIASYFVSKYYSVLYNLFLNTVKYFVSSLHNII